MKTAAVIPFDTTALSRRLKKLLPGWKALGQSLDYNGPVVWNVSHSSGDSYAVFWVPRTVPYTAGMNRGDQLRMLLTIRNEYRLPAHHLSHFGDVWLLEALIRGYYTSANDHVPIPGGVARTGEYDYEGWILDIDFKNPTNIHTFIGEGDKPLAHGMVSSSPVFALGVERLRR